MKRLLTGVLLAVSLHPAWAEAPDPLVDAAWVVENGCRDDVVVLDIRSKKIDGESREAYERGHIPCAVHSDYVKGGWRTKVDGVPGMVPGVEQLESLIGGLGIGNGTQVVIAHLGADAKSVSSATRVYWTLKFLGHDRVSILDGGTLGYGKEGLRALVSGAVTRDPRSFTARLRPELLAGRDEVTLAAAGGATLVDYRRADEYLGITRNGKTKRPGTLPGARNLPLEWLTLDNGGRFRSAGSLRQLMTVAGVDPGAEQIAFCNTAHNASLGWFVASELLGNPRVRLYDGSMAEWSRNEDLPVERQVMASE